MTTLSRLRQKVDSPVLDDLITAFGYVSAAKSVLIDISSDLVHLWKARVPAAAYEATAKQFRKFFVEPAAPRSNVNKVCSCTLD